MDGTNEADAAPPTETAAAAANHGEEAAPEQTTSVEPSQVSDEEVKQRLLVLLGKSDLTSTTEKMLRKQLEKELGMELSSKKGLIRKEVLAYLEQHQPEEEDEADGDQEEEEEEEEEPKAKKRSGAGFGSVLSEPMQNFLGVESMARPQVVKAIWAYIKEHNLQDPKDKRKIIVDDKLRTIFTPPITMLTMNKQLSNHVFSNSSLAGGGGDDAPAKPRPAKRAKKASDDGDASSKARGGGGGGGFAKPIPLSDELAAACGQAEMSRGAFNKWLYAYVDEHNLKDPVDKRFANCDETLESLTGEKRIQLFGGQKYFKEHFKK